MCVCIYVFMYVCIPTYIWGVPCAYSNIHIHIYIYMHICIYLFICICEYIYIYIYICIYVYTHICTGCALKTCLVRARHQNCREYNLPSGTLCTCVRLRARMSLNMCVHYLCAHACRK